jgi:hypothetical protein
MERAKVPRPLILQHVDWLLPTFTIVPVEHLILSKALKSKITDYKDAIVEQSAEAADCSAIITRTVKDYTLSLIPALTPEKFITSI